MARLCGHDEVEADELITSYGLTSLSVTVLATFIRARCNHPVSILELMTKATTSSLVCSILEVDSDFDGDRLSSYNHISSDNDTSNKPAVFKSRPLKPSVFACAPEIDKGKIEADSKILSEKTVARRVNRIHRPIHAQRHTSAPSLPVEHE